MTLTGPAGKIGKIVGPQGPIGRVIGPEGLVWTSWKPRTIILQSSIGTKWNSTSFTSLPNWVSGNSDYVEFSVPVICDQDLRNRTGNRTDHKAGVTIPVGTQVRPDTSIGNRAHLFTEVRQ